MEPVTKDKPKRASRSKKEVSPVSDSVVSAFGGIVAASVAPVIVDPVAPKGKAAKGKGKVAKAADVTDIADTAGTVVVTTKQPAKGAKAHITVVADIVTVDAVASPSTIVAKGAKAPTSVIADTAGAVVAITNPAIFIEELEAPTPSPAAKAKKSNGSRKPPMIAAVTPDGIKGSLTPMTEQRPLITHLPIHSSDIDNDLFAPTIVQQEDSAEQPTPFDTEEQFANYGQETTKQTTRAVEAVQEQVVVSRPSLPLHYSERLMVRFQDANRDQRLPDSTEVACFWDCHTFKGVPCIIPTMIEEGIWRVYGNFCSPECAAAYLFSERLDSHVRWERFALLNRLYAVDDDSIHLSPSRAVLRLFGGPMDISDYRSVVAEKRMRLDVMTPPMISIIQVMDTKPIDFYDASMKNTFIPWEMDRMNRPGAQGLRLRRKKPVAEKESTLEFCMGIIA
jgi:hypothetical protein